MITILLIAACAILVFAFGALLTNSAHAPEGYEDATGFHYGKETVQSPKRIVPPKRKRHRQIMRAVDLQAPAA